jgi:hypothetical protein
MAIDLHGSEGWGFESLRARRTSPQVKTLALPGSGVAEDLLQHLRRVTRLDHQRGGRVPQVMDAEPGAQPGTGTRREEDGTPPVRQSHDAAARKARRRPSWPRELVS